MDNLEDIVKNIIAEDADYAISDVVDPVQMFDGITTGVINAVSKVAKLFVVKKDSARKLLSVLDRNGDNFIYLRVLAGGVSLEVYFPGRSIPEVKVFNHWNSSYNLRIFKNLLDVIQHLKEYWEDPQLADFNRSEIDMIINNYRLAMNKF